MDTQMAAKHENNSKLVYIIPTNDTNNREAENSDEINQILAEMDVSPLTARVKRIRSAIRLYNRKGPKALCGTFFRQMKHSLVF